jgi:hypothetical protein
MLTKGCYKSEPLFVGIEREGVVFKLEAVLFIGGVLIVSAIAGWFAWNGLGFLVADAPDVMQLKRP